MQYSGKHTKYVLVFGKKDVGTFFIIFRKKEKKHSITDLKLL